MTTDSLLERLRQARSILGRAYGNDPFMRWVFPQPKNRADCIAVWLGLAVERWVPVGTVEVLGDPDPVAVGVWGLRSDLYDDDGTLPTPAGLLASLIGPKRAEEVFSSLYELAALAPSGPAIHLQFVAIEPGHQGGGHGGRLLRQCVADAERERLPIKVATANPVGVDFYLKYGFSVVGEYSVGTDGPTAWSLWRPPRES